MYVTLDFVKASDLLNLIRRDYATANMSDKDFADYATKALGFTVHTAHVSKRRTALGIPSHKCVVLEKQREEKKREKARKAAEKKAAGIKPRGRIHTEEEKKSIAETQRLRFFERIKKLENDVETMLNLIKELEVKVNALSSLPMQYQLPFNKIELSN